MGFINNPLGVKEWNLTMFAIIFAKFQRWIMSNRERNGLRRSSPYSQLIFQTISMKQLVRKVNTKFYHLGLFLSIVKAERENLRTEMNSQCTI